jgi:hypothetical protein
MAQNIKETRRQKGSRYIKAMAQIWHRDGTDMAQNGTEIPQNMAQRYLKIWHGYNFKA